MTELIREEYPNCDKYFKVFEEISGGIEISDFLERFANFYDAELLDECFSNENAEEGMAELWNHVMCIYKKKNMLLKLLGSDESEE